MAGREPRVERVVGAEAAGTAGVAEEEAACQADLDANKVEGMVKEKKHLLSVSLLINILRIRCF